MIEADSVASQTLDRIRKMIPKGAKVMVALDSDHTKPHVLKELELYKEFVTLGSYFMVSDTFTSKMAELGAADAKYINNSPMEAVKEFLKNNPGFVIDKDYNKLFTSYCPDGFLKRIK
jgi:cephalosporin hydroxylase